MQNDGHATDVVGVYLLFKFLRFFSFFVVFFFLSVRHGAYCYPLDLLVPDLRGRPFFGRTWIRGRTSRLEIFLRT